MPMIYDPSDTPAKKLSLTPLVDCVFILLVFFMLQSEFIEDQTLRINNPSASKAPVSDAKNILIEVHNDGTYWLDGMPSSINNLREKVKTLIDRPNVAVTVSVDRGVEFQTAIDAMDIFASHGISNIALTKAAELND
jgi:biopolymer transport protein ExbD